MNWKDHMRLYQPMNLAALYYQQTELWSDSQLKQRLTELRSSKPTKKQPNLELIQGDKE